MRRESEYPSAEAEYRKTGQTRRRAVPANGFRRHVVVELKAEPFDPTFVGQLNLNLSAADDLLRHPDDHGERLVADAGV